MQRPPRCDPHKSNSVTRGNTPNQIRPRSQTNVLFGEGMARVQSSENAKTTLLLFPPSLPKSSPPPLSLSLSFFNMYNSTARIAVRYFECGIILNFKFSLSRSRSFFFLPLSLPFLLSLRCFYSLAPLRAHTHAHTRTNTHTHTLGAPRSNIFRVIIIII